MPATSSHDSVTGRLSAEALGFLADRSEKIHVGDGATIVRRGEVGHYFYVVLSGTVEVRLAGAGGASLPLTRLGEGATFGEMALIRNEPVSADVVAVGDATLLACPEEGFRSALAECEALRMQLLARLAGDLQRTTSEAWDFFQKAEALKLLIRCEGSAEPLITQSAPMRKVVRFLDSACEELFPCLFTGEQGAGKLLVARTLHERANDSSAPLIIVDCHRLRSSDARRLLLGPPGATDAENALTGLGALHLARGGSLILRNVETLAHALQEELAGIVAADEPGAARLIATTHSSPGADSRPGSIHPDLEALFHGHTITVPPLRKRRKDIVPLSELFLEQVRTGDQYLGRNAENSLVSMGFHQGNVIQLRETVEFAARCTDDEIRSEHIFSGLETGEKAPGIDLGLLRGLRMLLRRYSLVFVRATVLLSFLGAIALCFAYPKALAGRAANGFVWSIWEPIVFALFLLVGSVWCTVCPLSTAGRVVRRFFSFDKPPPERLRRWGVWLMIAGFFAIIWAEHVFHMVANPQATAVMLLCLIGASMAFCAVYTREVWCRHVCPLGALATSLAPTAILEIGARPGVCTSTCTSHSCYKGEGTVPGCTVFHHPLNAAENHHCKLCLDCLKSCPNDSAKLFLRPPVSGIWKLQSASGAVAPFAVSVFLLSLVFLTAQATGRLNTALGLALASGAAVALAIVLNRRLPNLLTRTKASDDEPADIRVAVQVAFSLMILGWGPLMAYQFGNIPLLESLSLEPAPGSLWDAIPVPSPWTVLVTWQTFVVLFAAALAAIALARIRSLAKKRDTPLSTAGWIMLATLCCTYVCVALLLLW